MSLKKEIKKIFDKKFWFKYKVQLIRPKRLPLADFKGKSVTLVCKERDLKKAIDILDAYYKLKIDEILVLPTNPDWSPSYIGKYKIRQLQDVKKLEHKNYAIFIDYSYCPFDWEDLMFIFEKKVKNKYFLYSNKLTKMEHFETIKQKNFYNINTENLIKAYNLLSDKRSRNNYLECINQIITGNSYCKTYSDVPHYFHKEVKPENGDFIIDGGISEYPEQTIAFSQSVQKEGKIFAFEPNSNCYKILKEKLKTTDKLQNIILIEKGLWNCNTDMRISNLGGSSSLMLTSDAVDTLNCSLITIDDFVQKNNIEKIDFIKLDVEGAEPEVIDGAKSTIRTFKPKLAISVYHKPEHIFSILLQINEIEPNYKFYMENHRTTLYETVLYARVN